MSYLIVSKDEYVCRSALPAGGDTACACAIVAGALLPPGERVVLKNVPLCPQVDSCVEQLKPYCALAQNQIQIFGGIGADRAAGLLYTQLQDRQLASTCKQLIAAVGHSPGRDLPCMVSDSFYAVCRLVYQMGYTLYGIGTGVLHVGTAQRVCGLCYTLPPDIASCVWMMLLCASSGGFCKINNLHPIFCYHILNQLAPCFLTKVLCARYTLVGDYRPPRRLNFGPYPAIPDCLIPSFACLGTSPQSSSCTASPGAIQAGDILGRLLIGKNAVIPKDSPLCWGHDIKKLAAAVSLPVIED